MSKKIWTIIIGVGLIVLGAFLVFDPNQTTQNLIYYLGVALLSIGILKIISGIVNKESKKYLTSSISNGILNILFGIILMTTTTLTIKLISVFIGVWLIISSGMQLLTIFGLGNIVPKHIMLVQIVKLVIGIIVITTPVITIVFSGLVMGIILIIIGVYTLINMKEEEKVYKVKIK